MSGQCAKRSDWGLWAPLVCGRDAEHAGTCIDFAAHPGVSVGFTPPWPQDHPGRKLSSDAAAARAEGRVSP